MQKKLITLAVALALSGGAIAAPGQGHEYENKNSNERKWDQSKDLGDKATESIEIGALLTQSLGVILPVDDAFMRRVYMNGWSLDRITEQRVAETVETFYKRFGLERVLDPSDTKAQLAARDSIVSQYAQVNDPLSQQLAANLAACQTPQCIADTARLNYALYRLITITYFNGNNDPVAKWIRTEYINCRDVAGIKRLAALETQGQYVASAHVGQAPGFSETVVTGNRVIIAAVFDKTWVPAVYTAGHVASRVEATLGKAMGTQTMSLADRKLAAAKLFYSLPQSAFDWPNREISYRVLPGQALGPYELQFASGERYKIDGKGISFTMNGTTFFGAGDGSGGYAEAVKYAYESSAAGSDKVSTSKTHSSSGTAKHAEVDNGPRDNSKPIFKKKN